MTEQKTLLVVNIPHWKKWSGSMGGDWIDVFKGMFDSSPQQLLKDWPNNFIPEIGTVIEAPGLPSGKLTVMNYRPLLCGDKLRLEIEVKLNMNLDRFGLSAFFSFADEGWKMFDSEIEILTLLKAKSLSQLHKDQYNNWVGRQVLK